MANAPDGQRWSGPQWCEALRRHFFHDAVAGLPVLFLTDEDALAEIHGSGGAEAVASLSAAVRSGLSNPEPRGYFHDLQRRGARWFAGADKRSTPPFLHVLALSVLAATRMGTQGANPASYRAHFCPLLGVPDDRMPAGIEDLHSMWRWLDEWLNLVHGGRSGQSTIVADARLTNIGYPLSQTLFRTSDVHRLDDFFRWYGLEAGEPLDESSLVAHFRLWARDEALSPGAALLTSDRDRESVLARILTAYASRWDGTRSAATKTRKLDLRVVVSLGTPAQVSIRALQPDGYPPHLRGDMGGRGVALDAEDGIYELLSETTPRHLLRGFSVRSGDCAAFLAGSGLFILRADPELGRWASVRSFLPGERHVVLAEPNISDEVNAALLLSESDAHQRRNAPATLPEWSLFSAVVPIDDAVLNSLPGVYRASAPARLTLRGGLPLRRANTYLAGGAPDVHLPDTVAPAALALDGAIVPQAHGVLRLADYLPGTGAHSLRLEGAMETRVLLVASDVWAPRPARRIGIPIRCRDGQPATGDAAAQMITDEQPTVTGVQVGGSDERWRVSPVLLTHSAIESWCLSNDGQVALTTPTPRPGWLRDVGLHSRVYEFTAPFDAQFVVERFRDGLRLRQTASADPEVAADVSVEWCRLILDARPEAGADPALLAEFRALAEMYLEDIAAS